ncbi:MAG TPA: hypothetical protein VKA24_01305, partial [Gaiellaceae bacterium]|nr:hypothetical protein [Gaiellaceae bacterium]
MRWTRPALDARLDALEERYEGRALINAVVAFAETLTDEDRRVLQDALLARGKRQRLQRLERAHWADE